MSKFLSPQWLKDFYHFESTDELQRNFVFSNSPAEKHMLETEIKRREAEANEQNIPSIQGSTLSPGA
ncbi:hypothetical protein A8708_26585 [Paenibacillus oryzisoli]|uniref:Uncharacterized protein n=1 Tax=Paenibacillus oryzisoli TaxID=1850517 RepID=A0A198ADW8_9BACL|nr:hypothetical protein A8708_26585 [Paenibacillus oryzisoli]